MKEDFQEILNIYYNTEYYDTIYKIFTENNKKFDDILEFPEIILYKPLIA